MKKQLANLITSLRIVLCIVLLFLKPLFPPFLILYIAAGITDMIDGTVARETGNVSEFGSKLDTVADLVLVVVCLIKLIPVIHLPGWLIFWIVVIAVIRVANMISGYVTRKEIVALHTVMNKVTGLSHNHPEGIKGAEAIASVIFLARTGSNKDDIKDYIINEFGYDISRTCDEIRPGYHHVETCQETVPEAITAFLEGQDFEDVIRTAVSLGGDCDTLTCIAGSMAEAFYGVPDEIAAECRKRLPDDINAVLDRFNEQRSAMSPHHDMFLDGNDLIENAIAEYYADDSKGKLVAVLDAIHQRMHEDGHFIIPVIVNEEDENQFAFRTIQTNDEKLWHVVFTSQDEFAKGENSTVISHFIDSTLQFCLQTEATGYIINPWGQSFLLTKELIQMIYEADGGVEYSVPDEPITEELLEDGSFLKKAIEICNRNRTQLNLIKLARILRDSFVWVPCNMIMSDEDYETWSKAVLDAADKGDMDSLIGQEFTANDNIRMVPDILQNGDNFFFPVFTSDEEMGEYGEHFSKIQSHFLETMNLARNNEKNVCGIVINAFSESFVIPIELFDIITEMDSSIERKE